MSEGADIEIVGILLERHFDHIIFCNGTQVFLKEGVSVDHFPIGRSLTARCTIYDGKKFADEILLNPDWLLDSVEALPLAIWNEGDPLPNSPVSAQETDPNLVRASTLTSRLVA
jgi:hypothetical protein